MRRGGPPMLPVDPASVPPFSRVERGARGLRFAPVAAPPGAAGEPGAPLRVKAAAPAGLRQATVVADGALVLGAGLGVAYSLAAPRMHVVHDRRPPGLDRVVGAAGANAGLLHGSDGWRAVVLPSLGDLAADLGEGPVAMRADGRRFAVAHESGVDEYDAGLPTAVGFHEGPPLALCYAADASLVAAAGSLVGPPGLEAGPGSPVVELAAARDVPRVAARHEDGTISVWEVGRAEPLASWPSPVAGAGALALSADGALVALGTPDAEAPVAALVAAADGAVVRRIDGARAIAPAPAPDTFLVAGDWGCAWMEPLEEDG
jgi:hypothetical protein